MKNIFLTGFILALSMNAFAANETQILGCSQVDDDADQGVSVAIYEHNITQALRLEIEQLSTGKVKPIAVTKKISDKKGGPVTYSGKGATLTINHTTRPRPDRSRSASLELPKKVIELSCVHN